MIKIYLPDDFDKNPVIDNIFEKIANEIYLNGVSNISFTYKGQKRKFNSKQEVKSFLLSKDFYDYKFKYVDEFIRELINLTPNVEISSILFKKTQSQKVQTFLSKYSSPKYQPYYDNLKSYSCLTISGLKKADSHPDLKIYNSICKIFDYNKLNSKDRHNILNEIDVPVCPYCNLNYTIGYENNGSIKNTADIDHFYIKSKYPEYALCLYNFVPSCTVCNERIKHATDMTVDSHIYPYKESFDGKSHFEVTNLVEYLIRNNPDDSKAKISLVNKMMDQETEKKVENSKKDFELNERYKNFSYFAHQLIEKMEIYNETYINVLSRSFEDLVTAEQIKYAIFGANLSEKEYGKISLGKLKQDLLKQLGIFDLNIVKS